MYSPASRRAAGSNPSRTRLGTKNDRSLHIIHMYIYIYMFINFLSYIYMSVNRVPPPLIYLVHAFFQCLLHNEGTHLPNRLRHNDITLGS